MIQKAKEIHNREIQIEHTPITRASIVTTSSPRYPIHRSSTRDYSSPRTPTSTIMNQSSGQELFVANVSLVPIDKSSWVNGSGQKVITFDSMPSLREIMTELRFTPLSKNVLVVLPEVAGDSYTSELWQVLELARATSEVHFYIIPPAPSRRKDYESDYLSTNCIRQCSSQ